MCWIFVLGLSETFICMLSSMAYWVIMGKYGNILGNWASDDASIKFDTQTDFVMRKILAIGPSEICFLKRKQVE